MEPDELRLWETVRRAGKGSNLSESDLSFAEACLSASDAQDVANACEIILRCSTSIQGRQRARSILEDLCLRPLEDGPVMTILNVMLFIELGEYANQTAVRKFVLDAVRSNVTGIRVNAVFILARIAQVGDEEALNLLKSLTNDENEYVRSNARIMIKKLAV